MIKAFDLLKFLLLYFFLSRFIRLLMIKLTGNFVIGSVLLDASIVLVFFFYLVTLFKDNQLKIKISRPIVMLSLIFIFGIIQAAHFVGLFGTDELVRALSTFRRYILPLLLYGVFNYLFIRSNERAALEQEIVSFLKIILFIALAYQFGEFVLRTALPAFNAFYSNNIIAPLATADAGGGEGYRLADLYKTYFGGRVPILRVFGVGLDYFVSGAIIYFCYLFYALFSHKFKVISTFNLIVFIALVLTGSTQYTFPFLLFNGYYLFFRTRVNPYLKMSVVLLVAVTVVAVIAPMFIFLNVYWDFLFLFGQGAIQKLQIFLFGQGPVRMISNDIEKIIPSGGSLLFLTWISDFGLFTMFYEAGVFLSALIFAGYYYLLFGQTRGVRSRELKDIGIVSGFLLLGCLSHYPAIFDRMIYAYFMFLLAYAGYVSKLRANS